MDIKNNCYDNGEYIENNVKRDLALVLDGPSYNFFDEDDLDDRAWLLHITKHCRSVIACRLTPVQKQQLVAFVKEETVPKATTLAIGGLYSYSILIPLQKYY
jgi:magnesium-transporting ATPase (P-type)